MKKILISILGIALYLNPLAAQIKKGSWMIGGSMNLSWQNSLNVWINPKLGYFVTDRLLVGAATNFQFTDSDPKTLYQSKYIHTELRPFARFYFTPAHRFKFFNEVEAQWSAKYSKIVNSPIVNPPILGTTIDIAYPWYKYNQFWLTNRFGINYFLSDNLAVEAQIPYTIYYKEDSIAYFKPKLEYSFPKFTFNPNFRIRLFLNTAKQKANILAEKYLKKGNTTYGIQSNISLADDSYSTIAPNMGYFISDKWMIGTTLWIFVPTKGDIAATIGPEIRFYQPLSPKMQWLTQASTQLGLFGSLKSSYSQVGTGLNRFVSENISVQCLLNGDMFYWNDKFTIQPNLSIGFQYFMSKK
jgi:hypothetical protein